MFYIRGIKHLPEISVIKLYSIKAHDIEASKIEPYLGCKPSPCTMLAYFADQLEPTWSFPEVPASITAVFLFKKHKRNDTYKKFQTSDSKTILESLSPVMMMKNPVQLYQQGIVLLSDHKSRKYLTVSSNPGALRIWACVRYIEPSTREKEMGKKKKTQKKWESHKVKRQIVLNPNQNAYNSS